MSLVNHAKLCMSLNSKNGAYHTAELPSPIDDPDAYKTITNYMLHGPCGKDARNVACTTEGKCTKHFPKQFLAETFLDEEG
ncbi:hypothetical protein Tco_0264118 [Tanacetum coccineum]